jgi:hypothetical protein
MNNFKYSRQGLSSKEYKLERFLEIVPGAISWLIIIGLLLLSILKPLLASLIMIAFILYWLLRLLYMNIFLILSYLRLEIEKRTDWMQLIAIVDRLKHQSQITPEIPKGRGLRSKLSRQLHYQELINLKTSNNFPPPSEVIYHLVILPVIREAADVVEPALIAIKDGLYPSQRFLVIIALEQTATAEVKQDMQCLKDKYRQYFSELLITIHPANQPQEAKVKGANTSYAARCAQQYFKDNNIAAENVIVSCFDADTVANPSYFACLTYSYMVTPQRLRASYQPIPVYHNNIWQVPGFARIIDIGSSFFQLIEATHPKKLVTFSSHSMSFKALQEVDFWPSDMISDDSAIFWKAFIYYQGAYQVIPIYTTVSMNIATGSNLRQTFKSIYKQKRRWAWGVENLPIVIRAFLRMKKISWFNKLSYGYKLLDSFVSWATWSFLLLFGSWLPVLFASREFASSTVYYTAPRIRSIIFSLASVGIFICMIISLLLLPKKDIKYSILIKAKHIFEWLLIPVVLLVLSAVPALDAQTRLMLGKYMEFWVTQKTRNNK